MKKQYLFISLLAVYVGLFCFLGFYAFPQADDYALANAVRAEGFWRLVVNSYMNWGVSPFYQVIVLIPMWLNFKGYFLLPFLTCLFNVCVLYGLIHVTARDLSVAAKFGIALLMQAVWLAVVPGLNENFYWLDAMGYTWSASLILLASIPSAALLKKGSSDWRLTVLSLTLLLIASGFGPQTGAFLCAMFFCFLCWCIFTRRRTATIFLLAMTCVAFMGFLILYLSPGTAARMSVFGKSSKNIFLNFGVTAAFGGITALKFFTKPIVYLAILYTHVIAAHTKPFDKVLSEHLKAWHIFVIVTLIAFFQQAIAGFASGAGLPVRAEGLAIWIMGAAWFFLWAFGYRNEATLEKIRLLRIYPWRGVLLALCLILNSNFLSLIQDLRTAPLYAEEQKQREALVVQQKAEGKTDVVIPTLTLKPKLLFFTDLRPSPSDWRNQGFAEYWGVRSISALPRAILHDAQAQRDFQEGKPVALEALALAGDAEVQFMLGEIYDTTFAPAAGIVKDNTTAAKWYRMAAEQGHAHARRRLTRLYALGMGVPKNYFRAVGWLLLSQL